MTSAPQHKGQIRTLSNVVTAHESHDGAGVKLQRVFSPQASLPGDTEHTNTLDPFLLLDEFASDEAADYIGGFPDHPHRGFETVTYMLHGRMQHKDHLGNTGELVPGSVQWMTAASGIVHSEMPMQEEGLLQGFQLWINLPAAEKMNAPRYQEYLPEQIPEQTLSNGASVKVIAGEVQLEETSIKGPVTGVATQPLYLDVTLPPNTQFELPVNPTHTLLSYVYEGEVYEGELYEGGICPAKSPHIKPESKNRQSINKGQLARWSEGDSLHIATCTQGARLLVMAAKPLKEPVVHYGPFVMNTREEIEQAIIDYQSGRLTETKSDSERRLQA